jgi:hypothetical protein
MTFAEIRRGVQPGQEYVVTNAQVPELGPVLARVARVSGDAFYLTHPLGETRVTWPPSRHVEREADGTLHIRGTGVHTGRPFLTLVPVPAAGENGQ